MPKAKRHCRRASSSATTSQQSDSARHSDPISQHVDHVQQLSAPTPTPQHSAPTPQHSAPTPQHSAPTPQHSAPIINEVQNPQPTQHAQKSTKKWNVDLIDDEGTVTVHSLLCDDLKYDLPGGRKIVILWDELGRLVGNGAGLLGVYLGVLASSATKLPITYERWPDVSDIHKIQVWDTIKQKFQVNEGGDKKAILASLGKKWRDNRNRMFAECYSDKKTWETNLQERPEGVPLDQWVSYLQYKLSDKGKSYSEKNTANRRKQKITHTLGSKSIARKQYELETQTGRQYSRLEMYTIAHKKKDGSFVNEEARQQIEQLESRVENNVSEDDAFTAVLGKEHNGYVRGMGFGVCPSKVFKGVGSTSSNGSSAQVNKLQLELETERARVDSLVQEVQRFKGLEEQLAIVMRHLAGQGFNQVTDLGSPNEPRRSSSASHDPGNK